MSNKSIIDEVRNFYANGRAYTNQELYHHFDHRYGTQGREDRNHVLRATQQELKKNGELVNVGFGIWELA